MNHFKNDVSLKEFKEAQRKVELYQSDIFHLVRLLLDIKSSLRHFDDANVFKGNSDNYETWALYESFSGDFILTSDGDRAVVRLIVNQEDDVEVEEVSFPSHWLNDLNVAIEEYQEHVNKINSGEIKSVFTV